MNRVGNCLLHLLRHHQPQTNLTPIASLTIVRLLKKSIKDRIDYSRYPTLKETDLEEDFVHGGGPGGQKVNKAHNCVQLRHIPTNLRIKCHEYREGHKNRELARQLMTDKLDEYLNGDNSVKKQIERIEAEQRKKLLSRAAKKRELKAKFKESLNKDQDQVSQEERSSSDEEIIINKNQDQYP